MSLQTDAQRLSERCLKLVVKASHDSGGTMEGSVRAYNVLEQAAEYQQALDVRSGKNDKIS